MNKLPDGVPHAIAVAPVRPYNIAMPLIDLANPGRFLAFTSRTVPILAAITTLVLLLGLYMAFIVSPPDYQQGETVRIMYIHVPAAWLAMLCYGMMAVAALGTLVWRHPLADVAGKSAVPIGAAFTLIALVTGSLWGRPTWGTWWVWDARLTSVLILFLIYLGLIAVWRTFDDPGRAARAASILTLVGAINLPVIHYSVTWWNTLHQGTSVFRLDGSTIDPAMLRPLLVMAAGATLLFVTLLLVAMRNEIFRRRLRTLRLAQAGAMA